MAEPGFAGPGDLCPLGVFRAAGLDGGEIERAGLVRWTVRGRTHYCQINPKPLAEADAWLKPYERL